MKQNRTKRRSLLRANSLEAPAGFQIAPFIDVIFVMLLFYMVKFASVQREGSRDILLPADNDTPVIQGQEITEETLEIGSDREIYHNGEAIADSDLQSRFARLLRQTLDHGGAMVVTLQSAEQTSLDDMVHCVGILNKAGIRRLSFASAEE